eukprot:CAMPEP_0178431678 /NCGR_PEP_ID=MMETSP0689_2-20121128/31981_1 /TAXON_ID=160604 /ORGANISM="Amphidinium massartii, Strain CS-259" /LENGTH=231 /DNA_ID=CAMNT_0020053617 /DNA_START=27 /DNA_END=719 /DNA_ORIENTATION=+
MGGGGRGKRNHRREGGEGKHISSFAEVMARNEGEQAKGKGKGKSKQDDGADESSEEEEASEVPRKGTAGLQIENPNHASRNEEKEGVELTRRQREEIEKAAARRRYEELHKAGQTDEAKADLARLEEVRKRREEAAQKRKAEEEAKKANDVKGSQKVGMSAELKEALGGEATRMPGARSQQKKENKDTPIVREGGVDLYTGYAGEGEKPAEKNVDNKDGSIQSCRAVEEDF